MVRGEIPRQWPETSAHVVRGTFETPGRNRDIILGVERGLVLTRVTYYRTPPSESLGWAAAGTMFPGCVDAAWLHGYIGAEEYTRWLQDGRLEWR